MNLRHYQKEGVEFLTSRRGALLFDEMGTGKTPQTLCALKVLQVRNTLVVCPNYAIGVWEQELEKWWPEAIVYVATGNQKRRDAVWAAFRALQGIYAGKSQVVLTPYSLLKEVPQASGIFLWDALAFDECHKISNRETKTFGAAEKIIAKRHFFLSGTPIRKSPDELWCYLSLFARQETGPYWRFVYQHFHVHTGTFGKEILGPKSPEDFKTFLKPYLLRRLKSQVLAELPPKTRQAIWVDLPPKLRATYDEFVETMILEAESLNLLSPGGVLLAQNSLTLSLRLRQLCVCPELVGVPAIGPAQEALKELLDEILVSNKESVVVFSVFRQALPYLAEAAPEGAPLYYIHGDNKPEENTNALKWFETNPSPAVLFCTTSMAASWSATKASKAIFVGYSWSPIDNYQSEDRLHRFGQKNAVNVYYIMTKNTVDERVMEVLDGKAHFTNLVIGQKKEPKP